MSEPKPPAKPSNPVARFFAAIGPALIVASVVLGPGSILTSSKVGAANGFSMFWVVLLAGGLMACMVALSARLGVVLKGTLCDELAARLGRPVAVLVGLTVFLVCAGFQASNNLGVLLGFDPLFDAMPAEYAWSKIYIQNAILIVANLALVGFMLIFRELYKPVEWLMKILVAIMIAAFFGNFIFLLIMGAETPPETPPAATAVAAPSDEAAPGDEEKAPADSSDDAEKTTATVAPPKPSSGSANLLAIIGLISTTFSVAGAFYQSYLVREKGWTVKDAREGLVDSFASIAVLSAITLVIMLTAAIAFSGRNVELTSASDVARQLEPLFGPFAVVLFSLGIFAAAFSSFLVNAMIGGAMLADGLGLGGSMNSSATKKLTIVALSVGCVAALILPSAEQRVQMIIVAQASVVIGFPLLALSMIYLAVQPDLTGNRKVPTWMVITGVVGLIVVTVSAGRLGYTLFLKLSDWISTLSS